MIQITLKDGVVKSFETGVTAADVAKELGAGLYKAACLALINGHPMDLRTPLHEDCELSILTFSDPEGKKAFWHTASHILAQAVMRLYPNAKYAIGPAIDNGFYYDFEVEKPFSAEDLVKIEKEMAAIVKSGLEITRFELDLPEAKEIMKDQPYKLELIEKHAADSGKTVFYRQGEFVDLCAGPHLMNVSPIKAFKLTSATGAYWHGDSNLPMLCRIYGTAFPKASELSEHLAAVEEAKKRDHNIIGRQLKYFCTSDLIGQGLPLLAPKGTKLFQILNRYIQDKEEYEYGYLMTRTPLMAKSDLYKISGHWDHYKDGMFVLGDGEKDKEVFALRPMTCPFQYQIYLSEKHSYRDLPIRYGETATLFRNEASGEMHGLIRLRQFTISEGHLILRPDQLEEEFRGCVKLLQEVMDDIGLLDDLSYRLSKWDPNDRAKYIGEPQMWEQAEGLMRDILDKMGLPYTEAVGEAAFYGPKLDVQARNVHGKEDTLVTVQIDLMLARQFGMTYTDADNTQKHPYIIHRTSLGCYERTIALLLEKYAGALPMWLSPEQVRILPIGIAQSKYANGVHKKLCAAGLRCTIDERNEKIGYKIREAQLEKIPYMLIIGDQEVATGSVAVRSRRDGDKGVMFLEDFQVTAENENASKAKDFFKTSLYG